MTSENVYGAFAPQLPILSNELAWFFFLFFDRGCTLGLIQLG